MGRRDTSDQIIKKLQKQLLEKEQELEAYRQEVAEVNRQLEAFIEQIGSDLKIASHLQRILIPTEIPSIQGFNFSKKFIPSSKIGSDYFDIFEFEDKMRFGTIVASSAGHGMASLFLTVLLKLLSQIEATRGMEPEDVIKNLTRDIQKNLTHNDSVSVFYSIFDRRHYTLSYTRAGDIYGFLYKTLEDRIVTLDQTQDAISNQSKKVGTQETITLEPRDKIVLVSPGVIEAMSPKGELFGTDRVCEAILQDHKAGAHDVRNEVLYQVTKFTKKPEPDRDLSVLIIEVKDKILRLRKG